VERRGLRPFLKWVGGKRQLLPVLRRFYPAGFGRYWEPFVGSGAVFFDLMKHGVLRGHPVTLADANADLIGCYRRVADSLNDVIGELEQLDAEYRNAGREHYLHVRDARFNPTRVAWRAAGEDLAHYTPQLAAMLIYLNRTGYNGLFRQNASGEYNVPPGKYDKPRILNRQLLSMASTAFSTPGVEIQRAGFDAAIEQAQPGDFVYFDPPYAPLNSTANFRGYTGRGFSAHDQRRLQRGLIALAQRGVHVLLSNSMAADVVELYHDNADAATAGLQSHSFPARRSVNSRPDRRGLVNELVVSNVRPHDVALASAS
jgi:DNA adenine methylase